MVFFLILSVWVGFHRTAYAMDQEVILKHQQGMMVRHDVQNLRLAIHDIYGRPEFHILRDCVIQGNNPPVEYMNFFAAIGLAHPDTGTLKPGVRNVFLASLVQKKSTSENGEIQTTIDRVDDPVDWEATALHYSQPYTRPFRVTRVRSVST